MPSRVWRAKRRRTVGYRPYASPYTKSSAIRKYFYRYYANQQYASIPPYSSSYSYEYGKTKTGNYLRNWRDVIRAGGNATTQLSAQERNVDRNFPRITIWNDWRSSQFAPWQKVYSTDNFTQFMSEAAPVVSHYLPSVVEQASNRAASSLIQHVIRAHQQLQGGVILGELDKTARMLVGTARNLKQGVLKYIGTAVGIRKGRGTKRAKSKAIANSYLEATFGWAPLIHDAEDLAKTLARLTHESDKVRFRAGAEWEEQYSQAASTGLYASLRVNRFVTKTTKCIVVYRGFLRGLPYDVGSPPLERIISMSGFDLRSFVPTMWELVPWSFLVDYFTNIGECLQAWTLDRSVVKLLWKTTITESSSSVRLVPDVEASLAALKATNGTNGQNYTSEKQDGTVTSTLRDVSRSVTEMPLLVPQLTGLDLPWRQFANIGALFTAKMR